MSASTSTSPSAGDGLNLNGLDWDNAISGIDPAADNAIVASLVLTGDSESSGRGSEAASVPSAEEGFNLWEPEGEGQSVAAPRDTTSTQVTATGCKCFD